MLGEERGCLKSGFGKLMLDNLSRPRVVFIKGTPNDRMGWPSGS